MPYTTEEGGLVNNFAREPKMYQSEPLTKTQQRNYIFMGIGALALVSSLMFVAYAVSGVS